uniref:Trehalase n=1 Tax=Pimpla hypochondriaca TaxID=135724 RepID=TREA_PIMHY|nr:RecName: Full=Trehalase; AltName: Full=Alpha,alpha-trehalase; AltName: Full=Alpha,alpha-trehalose glucohydrolase; Flags: Precursor [Pimpla hypochondriaca]CAD31109.1 trehalase [Pimpla hypochondriaca]
MAKTTPMAKPSVGLLTLQVLVFCALTGSLASAGSIGHVTPRSDLCDSEVYCQGELLKTIQLGEVFKDGKTFVDHYQVNDPSVTVANFRKLMAETGGKPNKDQLTQYVKENFAQENEVIDWSPPDWQENPEFLQRVQDPVFRKWAKDLNDVWKIISRKVAPSVAEHPERHSIISVDNGFIVPGGRFQEFYYWDSYWVMEGLLLTGMKNTSRGILENFLSMVTRFGFIPNGGRVYYLMRSQPPLLIPMVDLYLTHTGDMQFLRDNIGTLEKELGYFLSQKTVDVTKNGKTYKMARYIVSSNGPRPESYREDYELAKNINDEAEKRRFYEDLKAAAESGWDFSSRWYISENGTRGSLSNIATRNIIPVELNAFLQRNARMLAQFHTTLGNPTKAKYYKDIATSYQQAIDDVLWSESEGVWLDFDLRNSQHRNYFFPTNVAPLYTQSFDSSKAQIYGQRAAAYLTRNGILDYMGGTPASLFPTGEQWDLPNAWPPLQSIIVQALRNSNEESAEKLAKELAIRWLRANHKGYSQSGQMFEKYDALNPGKFGGGGEYVVQEGFGWTNGVVYEFLNSYPNATPDDNVHMNNN